MKKLILTVAALMVAAAAYGQGQFLFNTRDIAAGNNVTFTLGGAPATGSDIFVEVLAAADAAGLANATPLAPALPLNRTGAGAGYTSPFSQIYTTTLAGGTANIGYRAYQGTSYAAAANKSDLITTQLGGNTPLTVALTTPPTPPNEVALGTGTVTIGVIPEPGTMALGLLGLGSLLLFRRRK
jgi:uncharacterized protein (TIGR03382 family)